MNNRNPNQQLAPLQKALQTHGERLQFQIGQPLCNEDYLPGHVLLIESGTARLVGRSDGQLTTLAKLESGSVIGAASLLRGQSCETVRSATDLVAWSVSDQTFQQLYNDQKDIQNCCDAFIWDAEVAALLQELLARDPKNQDSLATWLKRVGALATSVAAIDFESEPALKKNNAYSWLHHEATCP